MDLVLTTEGDLDQTAPYIASQQCVEAAGEGAGVLDNQKRMIVGAIGWGFDIGESWSAVGQPFGSKIHVETGTRSLVGSKRLTKLVIVRRIKNMPIRYTSLFDVSIYQTSPLI